MKNDPKKIPRWTAAERVTHWLTAITFILLALSGLALFHPFFFPLAQLFGGGVWTRILHPFFGVVMLASFGVMFFRWRHLSAMTPADWQWMHHVREWADGNEQNVPESGKLNGGQKLLFRLLAACMALLVLSGIVIWRAYFSVLFPVGVIRLAAVVHAAVSALIIGLIIVHIYVAIWEKESIAAMLYGWVRCAWAKQHHLAWFKQVSGDDK